jgi:hypothetical protein
MAFYWLNVKVFSRDKGGCVTRAAAYRAGERIRDERTRVVHNYSSRDDVVHKEILLPSQFSGSAQMDWARDRASLWNSVEGTDRRNARLAREVLVVLPVELAATQRVQLARRFGQELADRYLGAVDTTVHLPRPTSSEVNHHAHLLITPREVTPEGIGSRTILELSGRELRALGLGPSKDELLLIRERWARITNEALHEAGLALRIDHRRSRGRDVDPAPALPFSHNIVLIERRTGVPSRAAEGIRSDNRERAEARLKGPEELARVLQRQKEKAREGAIERARRRAARPKGIWSAVHSAEERLEKIREMYQNSEDLRERRRVSNRKYYQENGEALRQRGREVRLRAKASPQQQAARRWWEWREREKERERIQARVRAPVQERVQGGVQGRRRDPAREPVLTAGDSARNWLALRERQKQAERSQSGSRKRAHERAFGASVDEDTDEIFAGRKKIDRNRDYEYGL